MAIISKLVALLGVDPREFDKNLKKAEKTLSATAAKMQSIGRDLTIGVTAPLTAIGAVGVKSFADFDSALVKSSAIMSDASGRMDELGEAALDVARKTTFSAAEAADAFFFLASAGLNLDQSLAALPQVAEFAQAGMFDLARATDLLTDAQSALGLTVDDTAQNLDNMTRVADVLVKANTIANASVQQFSESLTNQAAAAARFSGVELEETVAVLAAFADQGIKGAEAGTKFSIVLRDLTTKAAINAEEFERLGVSVFDLNGDLRPIADILRNLEQRLAGASVETQKLTLLNLGFADRSVQVLQTLLGTSDAIREYEQELRNAGGTTATVAEKQLAAFSAQMLLLKNQVTELFISIGEELVPIIKDELVPVIVTIIEFVAKLVEVFSQFDSVTKKIIIGVVAFAAAIGPLLLAVGTFLKIMTAVAAVLSGPGIALILIGGGLLAGLALLTDGFGTAGSAASGFNSSLEDVAKTSEEIVRGGQGVKILEDQYKQLTSQLDVLVAKEAELLTALERPSIAAHDALKGIADEIRFNTKLELIGLRAEINRVSMALLDLAETPQLPPGFTDSGAGVGGAPVGGDTTGFQKMIEGLREIGAKGTEVFQGIKTVGQEAFTAIGGTIDAVVITNSERLENFFRTIADKQEQFRAQANEAWTDWLAVATDVVTNIKFATLDFFTNFSAGFGDAIAQVIVFQKDFEEVMISFLKNLLASVISTLTEIVAAWLVSTIAQSVIGSAIHAQRVGQALQLIFLNAFAATAGIPVVGPFIAPGVAAGAVAVATAGSIGAAAAGPAVSAAGSAPLGLDTGGLILADGVANLHQGERVLTRGEVRMMPDVRAGMMHVTVELDGRILTTKILPRIPHELRMRGI